MTQALVRKCPDPACPRIIIKSDGCNKMTCPCGAVFCNVCRARITNGYKHFCSTFDCQHKNCGKCGLWSSTKEKMSRQLTKPKEEAEKMPVDWDYSQNQIRLQKPPARHACQKGAPMAAAVVSSSTTPKTSSTTYPTRRSLILLPVLYLLLLLLEQNIK